MVRLKTVTNICAFLPILAAIGLQLVIKMDENKWKIPDGAVQNKTAIVTGASSGLGFETSRALAAAGARVIMACRNPRACAAAAHAIRKSVAASSLSAAGAVAEELQVEPWELDLADLGSVRRFAEKFLAEDRELHLLVNNAGIMATPYAATPQGVEMQHATNHLGHFALTGLLLSALERAPGGARVVLHSSVASEMCGSLDVHSLAQVREEDYSPWDSYTASKRANRYFVWSLNQRLRRGKSKVKAVACQPGYTATNLQHRATGMASPGLMGLFAPLCNALFAMPLELGAQPQLYAATEPGLEGGEVIGPRFKGFGSPAVETRGECELVPGTTNPALKCTQEHLDALWDQSVRLTGVEY